MKKGLLVSAIILMAQCAIAQLPNYVPASGLVGWWGFSGNANDDSPNLNDGVVNGATLTTDRFGSANSAYQFDGTTNIQIADDATFQFSNERSISLWIQFSSFPTDGFEHYFMYKQMSSGASQQGFHMLLSDLSNADYFVCRYKDGIAGAQYFQGAPFANLTAGQYNFVTWVTSSDSSFIYIDGNLITSALGSNAFPFGNNANDLFLGIAWTGGANNAFVGELDDIGIWNRALTECEIQDLYNAQLIDNNVTQSGALLSANQSGATYQWLDCDNGNALIIGETSQSYTPTVTGNYAVEVTVNGCTVTSACLLVDFTGISELVSPSKELIKIVDLMGRETQHTENTTLIYIYSDGTIERIFQTKIN